MIGLKTRADLSSQAMVVRRLNNIVYWRSVYPVDSAARFAVPHPLDSDLSVGQRYPPFTQLGPD